MKTRQTGFTVYQALLLCVFLGILLAFLIPGYTHSKNRAAVRSTMKDMAMWSRAIQAFTQENFRTPTNPRGPMHYKKPIIRELAPYLSAIRIIDWWGNPFLIWIGKDFQNYGIRAERDTDFLVISFGKTGFMETWTYRPEHPEAGLFRIDSLKDFERDLILWNDTFIRRPK